MDENKDYNLGTKPADGSAYSAGIAYVMIPVDVDRARYIAECYRTSSVSIFSEHNGFTNRVPIDTYSLNFITFPDDVKKFGSAVVFNIDPVSKRPVIIGILNKSDEISGLRENQFRFKRELNGKFVEIFGSPDGANIGLSVSTDRGGQVLINVNSEDQSGKLEVNIAGAVNINASQDTTIKQHGKLTLVTIDKSDDNQFAVVEQTSTRHTFFDDEHDINTKKLSINDGKEPFILGKQWAQFMKDLIKEIGNSTVTTMLGQMPLLNADQILEYQNKVDKLLSTIAFIDK